MAKKKYVYKDSDLAEHFARKTKTKRQLDLSQKTYSRLAYQARRAGNWKKNEYYNVIIDYQRRHQRKIPKNQKDAIWKGIKRGWWQ